MLSVSSEPAGTKLKPGTTLFVDVVGDELAEQFRLLVRLHDVDRAIIAPVSDGAASDTLDLIRAAKHAGVRVSLVPRMLEVVGSTVEFDQIDGLTMLRIRRFGLSCPYA